MMKQRFTKGDLVWIEVSPHKTWMGHFQTGMFALIVGSYYDQYGGGEREKHEYTVYLFGNELQPYKGECSWYDDEDMTPLQEGTPETREWLFKLTKRNAE